MALGLRNVMFKNMRFNFKETVFRDWFPTQTRLAPPVEMPNDRFGAAVSLTPDGMTAAVIAQNSENTNLGCVHIYSRTPESNTWTLRDTVFLDEEAGEVTAQTCKISADGAVLLVTTQITNIFSSLTGEAYIFAYDGAWTKVEKFVSPTPDVSDGYGYSADLSSDGSTVIVGAPFSSQGFVYTYTRDDENWTPTSILQPSILSDVAYFGVSVSLNNTTLVVGSSGDIDDTGSAYVFTKNVNEWQEIAKLTRVNAAVDESFGNPVVISGDGNTIMIGAIFVDTVRGTDSGIVSVFSRNIYGEWEQIQTILAPPSASGELFGNAIAVSPDASLVAISMFGEDTDGMDAGGIYLYSRQGNTWPMVKRLMPSGISEFDKVASSIDISADGKTIICGVPYDETAEEDSGVVYVFAD